MVVAGTHGKTTTTSLTGWLLTHGQLDPTVLVGGIALNFGDGGSSYRVGAGRHFVIEGDEYDSAFFDKTAKFLKYLPDIAVINNIEFDHADIYANLDDVRLAFRRLANLVPRNGLLLLGADSPDAAALRARRSARSRPSASATARPGRRTDIEHATASRDSRCGGAESRSAGSSRRCSACTTSNALAAIAVGASRARRVGARRRPARVQGHQAAARNGRRRRAA